MASIARVPIPVTDELLGLTSLVEKAKTLLKYDPKHVRIYGELSQTLRALGIAPLDPGQVEKYMRSKVYHTLTNVQKAWMWCLGLNFAIWAAAAYGYVSLCAYRATEAGARYFQTSGAAPWGWAFIPAMILTVVYVCIVGCWTDGRRRTWRTSSWITKGLENYGNYVPEFALSKAVEIKEKLPQATFTVAELEHKTHTFDPPAPVRDPDPFLIVEYGRERYYIDSWDEPKFERSIL